MSLYEQPNKIPDRPADFYLCKGAECWDQKGHFVCRISLKDGEEMVIAAENPDKTVFISLATQSLLDAMVTRYGIQPL